QNSKRISHVGVRRRIVIPAEETESGVDGMIDADAVAVERRRIGVAAIELRETGASGRAVGNGIGVEVGLHGSRRGLAGGEIGHDGFLSGGLAEAEAFI